MATRTKDQNTLAGGEWNVICDVCGFKFKSSDVRKRWDGLYVCKEDYEQRHPMDFQKGFADDESVPFSRQDSVASPSVYTDVGGNSNSNDLFIVYYGDENVTLLSTTAPQISEFNVPLTGGFSKFIQLTAPGDNPQDNGKTHTIYKTAASEDGTTLKVFGELNNVIREFDTLIDGVGKYTWNGSAWIEASYILLEDLI